MPEPAIIQYFIPILFDFVPYYAHIMHTMIMFEYNEFYVVYNNCIFSSSGVKMNGIITVFTWF